MNRITRFKLFLMMVLEFFIWRAWLPSIFGYLPGIGFTPAQTSWILNRSHSRRFSGCFSAINSRTGISLRNNFSRSATLSAGWLFSASLHSRISGRSSS